MMADTILVVHFVIALFIVGEWMQRLLFYRAPPWLLTTAYVAWALATLATLRFVPPTRKAR